MQNESTRLCLCGCGTVINVRGRATIRGHYDPARATERRFWSRVDKNGPVPAHRPDLGPCWLWIGSRDPAGYGQVGIGYKNIRAHRYSFESNVRALLPGELACHHCDNPPCVRPSHLFAGSVGDNTRDAAAKGRLAAGDRHPARLHPERMARGERNGAALYPERMPRGEKVGTSKLTWEQVREIRRLLATGIPSRAVGRLFGVNKSAVNRIRQGVTWREPDGP